MRERKRAGGHGRGSGGMEQNAARHLGSEGHEQFGVGVRAIGARDDEGIAAGFAFAADPARDQPDGRMEKKQRFDEPLHEVDEIVPAADVGQLVEQNHFDFVGRVAGERGGRQQDDRAEDADEDGRGDAIANGDGDAARDPKRSSEFCQCFGDRAVGDRAARAVQAAGADQAGSGEGERDRSTDEPEPGQVRDTEFRCNSTNENVPSLIGTS